MPPPATRSAAPQAPAARSASPSASQARAEEENLRERWELAQSALLERFDEPISKATALTRRTLALFPVRVWRHFLQHNGFLLAAGVSYQALFSIFAVIYVAFAGVGLWLGGSPEAVQGLIDVINSYIPGLISDDGGLFTVEQVTQIATGSASALAITGLIALGTAIWTAIGFVTFARRAVRDIFAIPPDRRSYIVLKARDFFAATVFGLALILGAVLSTAGTWALSWIFGLIGWNSASFGYQLSIGAATLVVSFAVTSTALAALVRFLTGTQLNWRLIWPGALLGGGAITVVQVGAGWLLSYTPSNPLLATFAIFVGLLLWFRVIGVIILVAAAWIAVSASDGNQPLLHKSEAERLWEEHQALLVAAQVRLRTAREERRSASWFQRWPADRAVRQAEAELAEVTAAAPPAPKKRGSLLE